MVGFTGKQPGCCAGFGTICANPYHGWLDGIRSGKQPSDGVDYAGPLTEAVLLGNVAVRFRGQKLHWDSEALRFTNLVEANRWLWRDYREG